MTLDDFLSRLQGVRRTGDRAVAKCPAHDDGHQSLSITIGDNGGILAKCHTGCVIADIVAALDCKVADLMPEKPAPAPRRRLVATYAYRDPHGALLYEVLRYDPKDFRQRHPDGKGGWEWDLNGVPRVLYRLPELVKAAPNRAVLITEGEKDADRLAALGFVTTTSVGGAARGWDGAWSESLQGRHVVLIPDNDPPGEKHMRKIAAAVLPGVASLRLVHLPGVKEKGDVSDWLDAGGTAERLRELITAQATMKPVDLTDPTVPDSNGTPVRATSALVHATADEIEAASNEPLSWTLEPLFTTGGVRLLTGLGKTYKSSFIIAAAISSATGATIAGQFKSTGGHSWAIVDAENRMSVWARRLKAVAAGLEVDGIDMVRKGRIKYISARSLYLNQEDNFRSLLEWLQANDVTELVLDSLTGIHTLNENDNGEMRRFFIDRIFRLRDEAKVGITILHHHRKPMMGSDDPSSAVRGAGDFRNVVDTHVALARVGKGSDRAMKLIVDAQRDAEQGLEFYLRTTWQEGVLRFEPVADASQFSDRRQGGRPPTILEDAITAVAAILESEPGVPFSKVAFALAGKGFSRSTIKRAWNLARPD